MPLRHPTLRGDGAAAVTPSPRKYSSQRRWRLWGSDVLMIGPAFALVMLFVIIPIGIAVYLSLTDWDGFTMPPTSVGFDNYVRLWNDSEVHDSARLTLFIGVIGALGCNVLGLGTALLLNSRSRLNSAMRALVFYPYVVGPLVLGFLWGSILGTRGAVNALVQSWGADRLPFLADPTWAVWSVIGVVIWASYGMHVLLYLAGLQTIDPSLIEAAKIDGASEWQTFWRVKLGLLAPTVTLNLVLAAIALLKVYELIVALTGGGPAGSTETIVYQILSTSFSRSQLGYSAAQSVVFMIVILFITAGMTAARKRADDGAAA